MSITPSKKKSKTILEAITFWGECRHLSLEKRDDDSIYEAAEAYSTFASKLREAGWQSSTLVGGFKQSYIKNNIVVKFPRYSANYSRGEILREYEQWAKAPHKFKKHLPRTYCILDLVLIQDYVMVSCKDLKGSICNSYNLSQEFKLSDYAHNHGHSKRGIVKFFDWVYNRTYDHLDDPKKELYA